MALRRLELALSSVGRRRFLTAVGGGAWTPARLTGLAAWFSAGPSWDFTDAAKLAACADGSAIRVAASRGGSASDATQATSSLRPVLRLAGGRWEMHPDGVDDVLLATLTLPQPYTVYLAGRLPVAGNSGTWFDGATTNEGFVGAATNHAASPVRAFGGTVLDSAGTYDLTLAHVCGAVLNGASSLVSVDGTETAGAAGAGGLTALTLLARAGLPTLACEGLCELVMTSGALSVPDRRLLATYLKTMWGTP